MLKVKKGKSIVGTKFNVLNCCAKSRTDKFFKESVLYFFLRLTRETFWDEKTTKREPSFQGAAILKMTGGTPEVRSVKINLIDFLHLTFDLIDF